VARFDRAAAVEVGRGPRDLQDAGVGARAQPQPVDREFEQPLARAQTASSKTVPVRSAAACRAYAGRASKPLIAIIGRSAGGSTSRISIRL
jgi:hypothetical protein